VHLALVEEERAVERTEAVGASVASLSVFATSYIGWNVGMNGTGDDDECFFFFFSNRVQ